MSLFRELEEKIIFQEQSIAYTDVMYNKLSSEPNMLKRLIITIVVTVYLPAYGSDYNNVPRYQINNFLDDYVSISGVQSKPVIHSALHLFSKEDTMRISYFHNLSQRWMMEIGLHYIVFIKKEKNQLLPIQALTHDSLYILRLWHPFYLLAGPGMSYLNPLIKKGIPLQKDKSYQAQVGFSLKAGLIWQHAPNIMTNISFSRWRGTKTNRLHGTSLIGGIMVNFM